MRLWRISGTEHRHVYSFSLKVVVGATGTRGKTILDSCRANRERLPWQGSMAIFDPYQFQDWRFLYHVFADVG